MNKVALLVSHKKNEKLLNDFLKNKFEVTLNLYDSKAQDTDLVITDYRSFRDNYSYFKTLNEKNTDVFKPILLIIPPDSIGWGDSKIFGEVDEITYLPINQNILELRIKNLLYIRKISQELSENYNFLARLTENLPMGICLIQDRKITFANDVFTKILNTNRKKLKGAYFSDFVTCSPQIQSLISNPHYADDIYTPFEVEINTGVDKKHCEIRFSTLIYNRKISILATLTDITERKQKEREIHYLSFHDQLTGLYNRGFLENEMKRLDVKRQLPISIIMADINSLKLINDTYGHYVGDELLKKAGEILINSCRKEDLIARWGGDEFLIFLPQTHRSDSEKIAKRIKDECKNYFVKSIPLSIAVGSCTKESIEEPINEIFQKAENRMYENKMLEQKSKKHNIISTLLTTLKEKSDETEEHAKRLSELSFKLGNTLGLSSEELNRLSLLAAMHDIGKVVIPEEILMKPGKLNEYEWEKVKEHPEIGYRIACSSEDLIYISKEILAHHEHWNGKGYPRGLKGENIPLLARIIAIVDAYDVMTNGRSYKKALPKAEALKEIKKCAGTQFDPKLVEIFENIVDAED